MKYIQGEEWKYSELFKRRKILSKKTADYPKNHCGE
jgi:hypothetical protein